MLIAGLDIGGSVTKGVLFDDEKIIAYSEVQASDSITSALGCLGRLLADTGMKIRDLRKVALTGSITRRLKLDMIEIDYRVIDEIEAIGLGGLYLSGKNEAIVVSVGTGTAIVYARRHGKEYSVEHLGGTGVGGGTIAGLGKLLLKKDYPSNIFKEALGGDLSRVNLQVRDIVGGPIGRIPAEATASNFGKVGDDTRPEDIALGLITMIAEVIATIAYFAAKQKSLEENIIFVGKLPSQEIFSKRLLDTLNVLGGKATIPKNAEYATAIGAAKALIE
jgi:type II pantothenate kinase